MPSQNAIGIDLGSSKCCVSVFQYGQAEIIPNEYGNRTTPSWIAFTEKCRFFGEDAKNMSTTQPMNTVYGLKNLLEPQDSPIKNSPLRIQISHKIQVEYLNQLHYFPPEQLIAMLLEKLKKIAEDFLGVRIRDVVITIPIYYTRAQCEIIKDAARICNLNLLRLYSSPVCAAICYGIKNPGNEDKNVLVFDLGASQLSVAILTIEHGVYEVKAVEGRGDLGGDHFDNIIMDHFIKEFQKQHGLDCTSCPKAMNRLRLACEKAKRTLSTNLASSIEIDSFFMGKDFHKTFSRKDFEELCCGLMERVLEPVEKSLSGAKMGRDEIDEVILVGGSTRIPKIQSLLSQFFNGKTLNKSINPDEAIAHGAAIYGAILSGDRSEGASDMLLLDVLSYSIGFEAPNGTRISAVQKNETIPVKKYAQIHKEWKMIKVLEGNRLIGIVKIKETDGDSIHFDIDANEKLIVNRTEINEQSLSREEIEKMGNDLEFFNKADLKEKKRQETKNELEAEVLRIKQAIKEKEIKFGSKSKQIIVSECDKILNWIDSNEDAEETEYREYKEILKKLVGSLSS